MKKLLEIKHLYKNYDKKEVIKERDIERFNKKTMNY